MAYATQRDVDQEAARLQQSGRAPLSVQETQQLRTRGWRDRRPDEIRPPVGRTFRPADYVNDLHRGTIAFVPSWRNYSYHTVKIPNGTVIDGEMLGGCNFTQIAPVTDAIDRSPGFGRNLTFRNCNLVNVKVYPDWTVENCNTAQIDRVGTHPDPDDSAEITDSVFVASHPSQVPANRIKPVGALE